MTDAHIEEIFIPVRKISFSIREANSVKVQLMTLASLLNTTALLADVHPTPGTKTLRCGFPSLSVKFISPD